VSEDDEGEEMNDRPQDRAEDRRRRSGPLGEEGDTEETTRRVPRAGDGPGGEDATTPQTLPEDTRGEAASERTSRRPPGEEYPETRVIRSPGAGEGGESTLPRGYPEAAEEREVRLREAYGGVDWMASFIGCVFAIVCSGIFLAFVGLVLDPLGFTLNLEGREIDTVIVTGLVVVGFVLFASYFLGGYVAGRLVRFDGGRNGAATVLWGVLLIVIITIFGSFLPGAFFELLQDFVEASVTPAFTGLTEVGLAGLGIIVGAILLELLGGFLGGLLGNSYHTRIDQTT
jgi:hypothetical protein